MTKMHMLLFHTNRITLYHGTFFLYLKLCLGIPSTLEPREAFALLMVHALLLCGVPKFSLLLKDI